MKYAAFLRAINVGGNSIIKMDELKSLFESIKFKNVVTYIQSGNIVFDSALKSSDAVSKKIQKVFTGRFAYDINAMVRTPAEIANILKHNPFSSAQLSKELVLYITFMSDKPAKEKNAELETLSSNEEQFKIIDKEIYTLLDKKASKPVFSNNLVEKKLGVKATSRNWNTILKIQELM